MADVNTVTPRRKGVQRPKVVGLRVDEWELQQIRIAAARAGQKTSDWLRDKVLPDAAREAA